MLESTTKLDMGVEISNSNEFHEAGLSPKTIWVGEHSLRDDDGRVRTIFVVRMSRIDGTLYDYVKGPRSSKEIVDLSHGLIDLIRRMDVSSLSHGDFHLNNIGYVFLEDISPIPYLQVIDHGFASNESDPLTDLCTLFKVMSNDPGIPESTRKLSLETLSTDAKRYFGINLTDQC